MARNNQQKPPTEIPEVISVHFARPMDMVVFPHFPVVFTCDMKRVQFFKQNPNIIIAPGDEKEEFEKEPHAAPIKTRPENVGVLGKLTFLLQKEELAYFQFVGEKRVYITVEEETQDTISVRWLPMQEHCSAPEEHLQDGLGPERAFLQEMFHKYITTLREEPDRRLHVFLEKEEVKKIIINAESITMETLRETMDGVMCMANHIHCSTGPLPNREIRNYSLVALSAPDVMIRIGVILGFLNMLLYSGKKSQRIPIDDSRKKTLPATPFEYSIKQLLTPRERPPRFPPRKKKEEPTGEFVELDYETPGPIEQNVIDFFDQYIVGQERGKRHVARCISDYLTFGKIESGPIRFGFYCGPTATGKTSMCETLARFIFDNPMAYIRLNGGSLADENSGSYIVGSAPQYVGYRESGLTQWKLDRHHVLWTLQKMLNKKEFQEIRREIARCESEMKKETTYTHGLENIQKITGWEAGITECVSIVFLDEFEKMHPTIYPIFYEIFDRGILTLRSGEEVSFKNTFLGFSSNINAKKIMEIITGREKEIGIRIEKKGSAEHTALDNKIYQSTIAEVDKFFSERHPEMLGKIRKETIFVYSPLADENLIKVLNMYLEENIIEIKKICKLEEIVILPDTIEFFLEQINDKVNRALGVRALQSILSKMRAGISNLFGKGKLIPGDWLYVGIKTVETESGPRKKISLRVRQRSSP